MVSTPVQISRFLEMRVFLERFGEPIPVTTEYLYGYYFTNVRSGLIVALVSLAVLLIGRKLIVAALNRYID